MIPSQNQVGHSKNISPVTFVHFKMVLLIKHFANEIHVKNILGRFGMGVTLAPVLLFQLYMAMHHSSMATSGELSTWVPLE